MQSDQNGAHAAPERAPQRHFHRPTYTITQRQTRLSRAKHATPLRVRRTGATRRNGGLVHRRRGRRGRRGNSLARSPCAGISRRVGGGRRGCRGRVNRPVLLDPRRLKFLAKQLVLKTGDACLGPLDGRCSRVLAGIKQGLAGGAEVREPRLLKLQAALERGKVDVLLLRRSGGTRRRVRRIRTAGRRGRKLRLELRELLLAARDGGLRGVGCRLSLRLCLLLLLRGLLGCRLASLRGLHGLRGLDGLRVRRHVLEHKLLARNAALERLDLLRGALLGRDDGLGRARGGLGGVGKVAASSKRVLKALVVLGSVQLVLGALNLLVETGKLRRALGIIGCGGGLLREGGLAGPCTLR
eukprot:Opistho-1_new@104818